MKVMIDETTYEGSGASKKLAKQVIFMKSSQTCSANLYACYDSCLLTVVFNDGFWWFDRPVLELHWLAFTNTPLHPTSHLDPETKNSKTLFQVNLKTLYRCCIFQTYHNSNFPLLKYALCYSNMLKCVPRFMHTLLHAMRSNRGNKGLKELKIMWISLLSALMLDSDDTILREK